MDGTVKKDFLDGLKTLSAMRDAAAATISGGGGSGTISGAGGTGTISGSGGAGGSTTDIWGSPAGGWGHSGTTTLIDAPYLSARPFMNVGTGEVEYLTVETMVWKNGIKMGSSNFRVEVGPPCNVYISEGTRLHEVKMGKIGEPRTWAVGDVYIVKETFTEDANADKYNPYGTAPYRPRHVRVPDEESVGVYVDTLMSRFNPEKDADVLMSRLNKSLVPFLDVARTYYDDILHAVNPMFEVEKVKLFNEWLERHQIHINSQYVVTYADGDKVIVPTTILAATVLTMIMNHVP